MDVLKHKRELEEYTRHIKRIEEQRPHIDMATPHSLGLKHLSSRPKKLQLARDRRQHITNENAMMMERMVNIVSNFKEDEKHPRMAGRNEAFRRREIERINSENRNIVDRLQTVPAIFDAKKIEDDFQNHLKDVKKMMNYAIPPKTKTIPNHRESPNAAREFIQTSPGIDEQPPSNMNAVSLFRLQVLSIKKEANREASRSIGNYAFATTTTSGSDPFCLFHVRR